MNRSDHRYITLLLCGLLGRSHSGLARTGGCPAPAAAELPVRLRAQ